MTDSSPLKKIIGQILVKSITVETHKSLQKNFQKTVTIWGFFEFSSVFSWQFSKISQKIAKRNDLWVSTVIIISEFCFPGMYFNWNF